MQEGESILHLRSITHCSARTRSHAEADTDAEATNSI